ncbi:FKBP-type peptidyl-prolyl cis-trans isomerase [Nocardioides sp. YIM 152315]|uniref:FKBP-type peptidyl-prolyl cis-trans isomerase n=1 Tax=Nocardioides sp. YIM 152315 TaxID=3031760 RepID=UPI0023DA2A38|nr:FKBP-type peptidyl-prolyl cis-trans isomerase [Nocardioides sp. YIM 152315]MDF1602460.1 FKBP-type peptidyl-prolyl cis-trans isomerase [Nocardioides sp. YIM 152315]
MSRRLRRLPALLLPIALATTLVACGDEGGDNGGSSSGEALHGIAVTGDVGKAPKVEWNGELDVDDTATEVVTEGDGEEVADGDQVVANIWIGNGTTQEKAYSTYDDKQPQTVPVSDSLSPVFKDALLDQTVGSRVAVTTTAEEAFGEAGNAQMGIGNKDTVLLVVDLMEKSVVLDGPEGDEQEAPAWAPELTTDGDKITGLDFSKAPEPDGKLKSATLIQGEGDVVEKGQTITVNYVGQVYGGKEPFDESYSGEPASFAIGVGQVVPGWDKTLVGQKVGSRVVMALPPKWGYGSKGNPQAGIKGTDTLYFVADILAAS